MKIEETNEVNYRVKNRVRSSGDKYTKDEEDFLRRVFCDKNYSLKEIADAINRSETSVSKKGAAMGMKRPRTKTPESNREGHKICNACKEDLPLEAYTKNKNKRYGVEGRCKACEKIAKRKKAEDQTKELRTIKKPIKKCCTCKKEYSNTEDNFSWLTRTNNFSGECRSCANERARKQVEKNYRTRGYKK